MHYEMPNWSLIRDEIHKQRFPTSAGTKHGRVPRITGLHSDIENFWLWLFWRVFFNKDSSKTRTQEVSQPASKLFEHRYPHVFSPTVPTFREAG